MLFLTPVSITLSMIKVHFSYIILYCCTPDKMAANTQTCTKTQSIVELYEKCHGSCKGFIVAVSHEVKF